MLSVLFIFLAIKTFYSDQLFMAVYIWNPVNSDLTGVHVQVVHRTIHFSQLVSEKQDHVYLAGLYSECFFLYKDDINYDINPAMHP